MSDSGSMALPSVAKASIDKEWVSRWTELREEYETRQGALDRTLGEMRAVAETLGDVRLWTTATAIIMLGVTLGAFLLLSVGSWVWFAIAVYLLQKAVFLYQTIRLEHRFARLDQRCRRLLESARDVSDELTLHVGRLT